MGWQRVGAAMAPTPAMASNALNALNAEHVRPTFGQCSVSAYEPTYELISELINQLTYEPAYKPAYELTYELI